LAFVFSSRRRHTSFSRDWSSDVCSSDLRDWLASERGMAATPHAQRSRADVRVELKPAFDELPVAALVDLLEAALGTPVQTAVKRSEERRVGEERRSRGYRCDSVHRNLQQ